MNADEFEAYLGLGGMSKVNQGNFATERPKTTTAMDKVLAGEFQGAIEDSYSVQPVISATEGVNGDEGPSSMFDSLDQEE